MAEMNPVSLLLNPTALKPTPFAGIVGGLCGLCALLIALRLWTNFNHHKLFVDDCKYYHYPRAQVLVSR